MSRPVIYADATGAAVFQESFIGDLAPFNDPVNHLPELLYHSSLDGYALAQPPATVTVSHPLVAPQTGVLLNLVAYGPSGITIFLGRVTFDYQLCTHSLGIVPIVQVLDSAGNEVPCGFPIQSIPGIGHRQVCVYATSVDVRMLEIDVPGTSSLAADPQNYTVYVYEAPTSDPSKPMLNLEPADVIFGQGKFDLTQSRLRRAVTGETPYLFIPQGRMTDIANGVARCYNADGTFRDVASVNTLYNGSFVPAAAIAAVVV